MAYNTEKLAKLEALKALAERVKSDYATKESVEALTDRVGGLETAGGEPNVITAVKVNGTAQTITAKASGLYKVTVDALGHVTAAAAVAKADITALGIPAQDTTYSPATASANGLMAAADKSKLDGLDVATTAEVTEMLNEVFTVGA